MRTPRSNAAFACSAVASEWPHETAISRRSSVSTSASAPGSSGARVTSRTGPASSRRSSSSRSGFRRAAAGWIPRRRADRNGPSRCAPRMRAPSEPAGTSRRAARSCSSGEVMNVGRKAVTPVSRMASAACRYPSVSAVRKSTPAKPLTWRSTKPGTAMPRPFGDESPKPAIRPLEDLDVAGHELAVDEGRLDAEPHSASSSAAAMLRSERSRRRRAAPASTPARSETIATRASPSAAARASSTC